MNKKYDKINMSSLCAKTLVLLSGFTLKGFKFWRFDPDFLNSLKLPLVNVSTRQSSGFTVYAYLHLRALAFYLMFCDM